MPNKSQASYEKVFSLIKDTLVKNDISYNWEGHKWMTDFEAGFEFQTFSQILTFIVSGMRNGISSVFPDVHLLGCFFHYSQQIIKRMKKAGFQATYNKDDEFNAFIRRCCSLPFVPQHMMDQALNILQKKAQNMKEEKTQKFSYSLLDYLKSTWVSGCFSVQDWNLFDIDCQVISCF